MEDFTRAIKTPQLPHWLVKPGLLVIPMYKLCPKEFFLKWIWPKIIVEILVEPNPHPGVTQPIRWLGGNIAKSNPVVSFLTAILHRGPRNCFLGFFSPFAFYNLDLDFFSCVPNFSGIKKVRGPNEIRYHFSYSPHTVYTMANLAIYCPKLVIRYIRSQCNWYKYFFPFR
jgi:hypothetical protein